MTQRDSIRPAVAHESLGFHIAGADVRIYAPAAVLEIVAAMLANVSRELAETAPPLRIDVCRTGDVWRVRGTSPQSVKVLGSTSALVRIAGTTIASALAEIAASQSLDLWRAAVVERNGLGLALVGDDWESRVTLTAHLHSRGWRLVSGDYALVTRDRIAAHPFRMALHANSSSIGAFPLWYRSAVEASPWYSTGHVMAFYAIDPTIVRGRCGWAEMTPIRAVLKVDGHIAEHPELEAGDDFALSATLQSSELNARGIPVASLVLGDFVHTGDFLEDWFDTVALPNEKAEF